MHEAITRRSGPGRVGQGGGAEAATTAGGANHFWLTGRGVQARPRAALLTATDGPREGGRRDAPY